MHVVDYPTVLNQAAADGLRCVYPNSGAFTLAAAHEIVGWIGPDDATIRPSLTARLTSCPAPFPANLAAQLVDTWKREFPGPAWLLPRSHWAYELRHAHQDWLIDGLTPLGINVPTLASRSDAPAIEFATAESAPLQELLEMMLSFLKTSDYTILFPGHRHVVTVHHHQQLWWQTADQALANRLAKPGWSGQP